MRHKADIERRRHERESSPRREKTRRKREVVINGRHETAALKSHAALKGTYGKRVTTLDAGRRPALCCNLYGYYIGSPAAVAGSAAGPIW